MSELHANSFTSPDITLEKSLPMLRLYTGLPVIDHRGVCVGVLSDTDVRKFVGRFVTSDQLAQMKSTRVRCAPLVGFSHNAPLSRVLPH